MTCFLRKGSKRVDLERFRLARHRDETGEALLATRNDETHDRLDHALTAPPGTAPLPTTGSVRNPLRTVYLDPSNYRRELPRALQVADVIEFADGTYSDLCIETERPLTLTGQPGATVFSAINLAANNKATIVTGADAVIRNITFVGAVAIYGNGAGIRHEQGDLMVENCVFRRNQNSILAARAPTATITVRRSSFIENGADDGHAHGLYVADPIARLTVEDSVFVGTNTGHHLKSRAQATIVARCKFGDGVSGSASYAIDIPNSGYGSVTGNCFRKAPNDKHVAFINYGGEGRYYTDNRLSVTDNEFIGRRWPPSIAVMMREHADRLDFARNSMGGTLLSQAGKHGLRLAAWEREPTVSAAV